jgi:PH (Pleckstrin Homology) domain-containing protein
MRLVTPGDSAPASIHRYLLPHEAQVITVRRHPAVLMTPIAFVLGGLVIAGVLSNVVVDRNGSLVNYIWWAWLILLAWFVWKVATWSVDYFVITNQRMLLTTGLITRKVAMMPLAKVTDMSFQRSIGGRMLGYGEFVLESAGQDQAFRIVSFLPYPEQLYLEVCSMIFPSKEPDDDPPKPAPPPPPPPPPPTPPPSGPPPETPTNPSPNPRPSGWGYTGDPRDD